MKATIVEIATVAAPIYSEKILRMEFANYEDWTAKCRTAAMTSVWHASQLIEAAASVPGSLEEAQQQPEEESDGEG